MKLRLECGVSSHTICDELLEIELENGHVLTLYPDESGFLHQVAIEAKTSTWETNTSTIPEEKTLQLVFKFDEQLKEKLLPCASSNPHCACMAFTH
jgi:hypothetical protein